MKSLQTTYFYTPRCKICALTNAFNELPAERKGNCPSAASAISVLIVPIINILATNSQFKTLVRFAESSARTRRKQRVAVEFNFVQRPALGSTGRSSPVVLHSFFSQAVQGGEGLVNCALHAQLALCSSLKISPVARTPRKLLPKWADCQ